MAEVIEFALGDQIQVISDKVYRYTKQKLFQAVGNVVVIHRDNAIYGEKASLNLQTGEIVFVGNIRFVAPAAVLYGSELYYNLKTREAIAKNARFTTENVSLVGKKIIRREDNTFTGENIEYTTCQDCPESWSVLGRKLNLKLGEYVHIRHAYLKAKGVPIFYSPYIVFPIKDKRQSGFLFPKLSAHHQGLFVQVPWYYAGTTFDVTLSPSAWGQRGKGGEIEYRHFWDTHKWLYLYNLHSSDRIYYPHKYDEKKSGTKFYRLFAHYEHHFDQGITWSHHLKISRANDYDIVRDYDELVRPYLHGPDLASDAFVTYRRPWLLASIETFNRQNLITRDERRRDKQYVQILPRLTLASIPWTFWQGRSWPSRLTGQASIDFTVFSQNKRQEDLYLRNARRMNFTPYLTWNIFNGQAWQVQTKVQGDFQTYQFVAAKEKSFQKNAVLHESEISLKAEKIWSIAYQDRYPVAQENFTRQTFQTKMPYPVTGNLPTFVQAQNQDEHFVQQISYRHQQEWKLKHYWLSSSNEHGNAHFRGQIQDDAGRFDFIDAPRALEVEVPNLPRKKRIPLRNTLELQWNNTFQKKTPRAFNPYDDGRDLRHNFTYQQVSYVDLSQGIDLAYQKHRAKTAEASRLTRLLVEGGIFLGRGHLTFSESYYHKSGRHIIDIGTKQRFDWWSWYVYYSRDYLANPTKDLLKFDLRLALTDRWFFKTASEYDLKMDAANSYESGLVFFPSGHCWSLAINYTSTQIEKRWRFDFALDFSGQALAAPSLL